MVKAINTAAGLGAYCIVYYVPMDFQHIKKCLSSLNNMGFLADVGIIYLIELRKVCH